MLSLFPWDERLFTGLVALTLLAPLAVAALVARFPQRAALRALGPLTVLPALALALGPRMEVGFPTLVLGVRFGVDAAASVFLLFSAVVWGVAGWFSLHYLAHDANRVRHSVFFHLAQAGNLGVVLAQDVATFYFCFALMSFASYVLVVHDGLPASRTAGRIYLTMALIGEVIQFIAFSMISLEDPDGRLSAIPAVVAASPYRDLIVVLVLVALGIKFGLVPLHVWLPLAHPAAPAPASAVLSGCMIKAGLLGWIRFLPLGLVDLPGIGQALMALGVVGSLGGALIGVTQRHPKAVLAYSSISQMGLMAVLVGIALARAEAAPLAILAAILYALHHALAKGALFLGVGMATSAAGGRATRALLFAGCALAGLSLAGGPVTSGLLAKTALKKVAAWAPAEVSSALALCLSLGAVGTTLLMARFLVRLHALTQEPVHHEHASKKIWLPWLLLLGVMMALPWWVASSLNPEWAQSAVKTGVWGKLLGPILLGLLLAVGAYWLRRSARPLEIPAGDLLLLYQLFFCGWRVLFGVAVAGLQKTVERVSAWLQAAARLAQDRSRWLARAEAQLSGFTALGLALAALTGLALWAGR